MREYKVLEVIWFNNYNFDSEYVKTFNSLKKAQAYVDKHVNEWIKDYNEIEGCVAVGVEIETWNEYDIDDTYTHYYIGE